jgi:hypothetical protein
LPTISYSAKILYLMRSIYESRNYGQRITVANGKPFWIFGVTPDQEGSSKGSLQENFRADGIPLFNKEHMLAEESLPLLLRRQLHSFIGLHERYNQLRPDYLRQPDKAFLYTEELFTRVLEERLKRSKEFATEEYQAVARLANSLFPKTPNIISCMDSRTAPARVFGISYGIGSSLRAPGGMPSDFIRNENGELQLIKDSQLARYIDKTIREEGMSVEVVDAHIDCAKRKGEEEKRGYDHEDDGLMQDAMYKKEMMDAMKRYARETYGGDESKVMNLMVSYVPDSYYMYMGLETDHAMKYAREYAKEHGLEDPEFTTEVRNALAKSDKGIIYTGDLVKNKSFVTAFENLGDFPIDWIDNAVPSLKYFWEGVAKLKPELMPILEEKILKVYSGLNPKNERDKTEIEMRAMLLLTNTFMGYLNKKYHVSFGDHMEQIGEITERPQPPYRTPAFSISNSDVVNLPDAIESISTLVRKNRKRKTNPITDPTGMYESSEYKKAPVLFLSKEIVHDAAPEQEWEKYQSIDWSDMPKNWDKMSTAQFLLYLSRKGAFQNENLTKIAADCVINNTSSETFAKHLELRGLEIPSIAKAIDELRRKMATVYDPRTSVAQHLVDGNKIILSVISSKDRKIRMIIPFARFGFSNI